MNTRQTKARRLEWFEKAGQRCENCRFVRYWGYGKQYTCKRYAPQTFSFLRFDEFELMADIAWSARKAAKLSTPDEVPEKERSSVENNMLEEATEIDIWNTPCWPRVEKNEWCGEWQPIPVEEK